MVNSWWLITTFIMEGSTLCSWCEICVSDQPVLPSEEWRYSSSPAQMSAPLRESFIFSPNAVRLLRSFCFVFSLHNPLPVVHIVNTDIFLNKRMILKSFWRSWVDLYEAWKATCLSFKSLSNWYRFVSMCRRAVQESHEHNYLRPLYDLLCSAKFFFSVTV